MGDVISFPLRRDDEPERERAEQQPKRQSFAEFMEYDVLDFVQATHDLGDLPEDEFWLRVERLREQINGWRRG